MIHKMRGAYTDTWITVPLSPYQPPVILLVLPANMSDRYVISVENRRGANTNYAVFMDPPEFSGGQQPFMNVWYTSFVPYQGSFEVQTGRDFYPCL